MTFFPMEAKAKISKKIKITLCILGKQNIKMVKTSG